MTMKRTLTGSREDLAEYLAEMVAGHQEAARALGKDPKDAAGQREKARHMAMADGIGEALEALGQWEPVEPEPRPVASPRADVTASTVGASWRRDGGEAAPGE